MDPEIFLRQLLPTESAHDLNAIILLLAQVAPFLEICTVLAVTPFMMPPSRFFGRICLAADFADVRVDHLVNFVHVIFHEVIVSFSNGEIALGTFWTSPVVIVNDVVICKRQSREVERN